eukprot:6358633-Pyramimonas_sp.AAC.2
MLHFPRSLSPLMLPAWPRKQTGAQKGAEGIPVCCRATNAVWIALGRPEDGHISLTFTAKLEADGVAYAMTL